MSSIKTNGHSRKGILLLSFYLIAIMAEIQSIHWHRFVRIEQSLFWMQLNKFGFSLHNDPPACSLLTRIPAGISYHSFFSGLIRDYPRFTM